MTLHEPGIVDRGETNMSYIDGSSGADVPHQIMDLKISCIVRRRFICPLKRVGYLSSVELVVTAVRPDALEASHRSLVCRLVSQVDLEDLDS